MTNRLNTFLDATYIVPRRMGRTSLRLRPPRPRAEQIYFIGATNVPIDRLDPALIQPGRMGRHVWFRTPTKHDRLDVFDLYLGKVAHDPDLDTDARRDELARITNGYSPAMIDQVCSMALTIAHHTGRERFSWADLVEAMTTIESGTAIGIEYIQKETEAVAIHEAGHAVAGHVYMEGSESTRLSIRMRGGSLGHHQALDKEERFSRFRSEEMARLVWTLGAMAAERVFYGENSSGVGGDVMSATTQAAYMVGAAAMGPEYMLVVPLDDENEEQARERVLKRFEKIGVQIMNRTGGGGGPFDQNPISGVLSDPAKKAMAAQILGQAYVQAYNLVRQNRDAVLADRRRARRAEGDLRRRPRRAARPAGAEAAGDRLRDRGRMADVTECSVTEPTQEERESLIQRPRECGCTGSGSPSRTSPSPCSPASPSGRRSSSPTTRGRRRAWRGRPGSPRRAKRPARRRSATTCATRYTHPDGSPLVLVFAGEPSIKTAESDMCRSAGSRSVATRRRAGRTRSRRPSR